jgi:hypothetical protein
MIRILAERELRFTGYGVRLMTGENELPDRIPYGLRKSLERHEKFGHIAIEWDVPEQGKPKPAKRAKPKKPQKNTPDPAAPEPVKELEPELDVPVEIADEPEPEDIDEWTYPHSEPSEPSSDL